MKIGIVRINKYRLKHFWICFSEHLKQGDNFIISLRLGLWWLHSGFNFEGDKI
jgi:hypothetical protein